MKAFEAWWSERRHPLPDVYEHARSAWQAATERAAKIAEESAARLLRSGNTFPEGEPIRDRCDAIAEYASAIAAAIRSEE